MAAARCPSYAVHGVDAFGNTWDDVITLYDEKLVNDLRRWWVTRKPVAASFPELSEDFLNTSICS
jgi:hypothetical protein|tara:strand:- start:3798 stop:3992 length:195 start_codon:yes stop_codon:yes gene_type:complete